MSLHEKTPYFLGRMKYYSYLCTRFPRNRWQEPLNHEYQGITRETGKQHPSFKAGDTVTVAYKIIEGSKERIQLFRGVVIKISGHQEKKRFTVRKMSGTVGVERIFPLESPNIESIEVNKVGKVRRAKLYYLRNLTGKAARIKEKRSGARATAE